MLISLALTRITDLLDSVGGNAPAVAQVRHENQQKMCPDCSATDKWQQFLPQRPDEHM